MNKLKTSALIAALLVFAVFSSACGPVGNKIVRYSDKGTRTVEQLRDSEVITVEEANAVLPFIADVRAAGQELARVEAVIAETKEQKATKREQIRVATQAVIDAVSRLNNEGLLHIKNPERRAQVRKVLAIASIVLELTS